MRLTVQGNADHLVARLGDVPDKVAANLKTVVEALEGELLEKARAAAPERTGALKASIEGRTIATRSGAVATVGANPTGGSSQGSRRDYYALWQEFGATIPPHKILPDIKRALAFNGLVRARAQSPGGEISAKKFIHGPFADMRSKILSEMRRAVEEGLKE